MLFEIGFQCHPGERMGPLRCDLMLFEIGFQSVWWRVVADGVVI